MNLGFCALDKDLFSLIKYIKFSITQKFNFLPLGAHEYQLPILSEFYYKSNKLPCVCGKPCWMWIGALVTVLDWLNFQQCSGKWKIPGILVSVFSSSILPVKFVKHLRMEVSGGFKWYFLPKMKCNCDGLISLPGFALKIASTSSSCFAALAFSRSSSAPLKFSVLKKVPMRILFMDKKIKVSGRLLFFKCAFPKNLFRKVYQVLLL